jgi:hypothetical protein
VLGRALITLSWVFVFALATGLPSSPWGLTQVANAEEAAEEEERPAEEGDAEEAPPQAEQDETESPDSTENHNDQDTPAEDSDEAETEETPPAEEPKANNAVIDKEEQAKAEDAGNEKVTDAQKAADEEEEAKAAEAEAAGAEVEIDQSDEVEEEPKDSEESPAKPVVREDKPEDAPARKKRVIGATATIMEKQSELLFRARIDSGAKSCSLHIEDYKIENESDTMAENIGKIVRFHVMNGNQESHWLEAKIAGYVIVKTAAHRERRYKVPLTFRYKDFEKTVLVTLNNREKMEYPLLLGRNFLMGDFVVDVEIDNNELHTR